MVGVDVGQSWVRCAVADLAGDIVGRLDIRNTSRTVPSLVTSVSRLAHQVVEGAGIPWSRVVQTVVGSPGVFDPGDGTLLLASRIRRWGRPGLLDALREELGERTAVANDANLAAVGERWFGCGIGVGTFVYLLVGTGVGMGIVIDGKLHVGARGAAGEVAYLPFGDETLTSSNGQGSRWGSFEEVASAQGVIQDAVELGMSPRLSARRIFDAARRGDAAARSAVDREGERLAAGHRGHQRRCSIPSSWCWAAVSAATWSSSALRSCSGSTSSPRSARGSSPASWGMRRSCSAPWRRPSKRPAITSSRCASPSATEGQAVDAAGSATEGGWDCQERTSRS